MTPSVRHWLCTGFRAAERFLAVFGLGVLIYFTCFDLSIIISGSMSPSLQGNNAVTGDRILFEKLTDRLRAPHRWEIHQFHTPEGLTVAKRIVAFPVNAFRCATTFSALTGNPSRSLRGLPICTTIRWAIWTRERKLPAAPVITCSVMIHATPTTAATKVCSPQIGSPPAPG